MKTSKLVKALIGGGLIGLASVSSLAAGLGRLTVQSALGQPLVAEIELLSVQKGEADSLAARIASASAFQEAKIDYAPILNSVRFSVEKRANGQPYLRLTTTQPVEEPFVDMLVELSSSSGRLVREFPVLLDPPGTVASKPAPPAPKTAVAPAKQPAAAAPAAPSAASPDTTGAAGAGSEQYTVKSGDTLYKIAGQLKPGEVNLDQLVVALFRENRQAFMGDNMNRMKSGTILRVPSTEQTNAVTAVEAKRDIRAQAADWNAYRNKLAGEVAAAPAAADESSQSAAGKIGKAGVEQPTAPAAAAKDVLKLSKGADAGGSKTSEAQINALREEAAARENQIREEKARVAQLEKNIQDMQQLLALKNQSMAELQKQAEAGKAAPAAAPKASAQPVAPHAPAPEEAKPAPAAPPMQATPAPTAQDQSAPPKSPIAASEPSKPAADAPPAAKKPVIVAPVAAEPSLLDEFLDNPMYQIAAAGVLALLALFGYGAFKRRRPVPVVTAGATSSLVSDLKSAMQANSKASGVVDTGNSSFLTDFEKTGPGIIDVEEVDPVAEAEVYIAYGRDAQAEEILKEAMVKDTSRHEIPLKLLEIYAARKSAASFEAVARDMQRSIGSNHPLWNRVADMGRQLDPGNALYSAGGVVAAAAATPTQPLYSDVYGAGQHSAPAAIVQDEPPAATEKALDFDLTPAALSGIGHGAQASEPKLDLSLEFEAPNHAKASDAMDFDLGGSGAKPVEDRPEPPAAEQTQLVRPKLDAEFSDDDLDLSEFNVGAQPAVDTSPVVKDAEADSFLPRLNGTEPIIPAAVNTATKRPIPALDFGSLNLDLSPAAMSETAAQDADSEWHSVATKLDLARAYLEIGDKDGAREILQEVLEEGDGEQKREAETLTAGIH